MPDSSQSPSSASAASPPAPRSTRRGALVTSTLSALAAASGFPRTQLHAAPSASASRRLRMGIVGGRFGASFQWHEHPHCQVTGVTDLRPDRRKRLSRVYRCSRTYDSMETMLKEADDVDAVGIFTEAPNHVKHSIAALESGRHVICAVPAAMTLEECQQLIDTVRRTGLTFMMAETSYWQQTTMSARRFFQAGEFGTLFGAYSMYRHPGLETLWFENGRPTWRHGFPPMHYPTHCTAHLTGVTGERLTEVTCHGWGDDAAALRGNAWNNPFWNETAQFRTDRGHSFRVEVWWAGAIRGCERAEWYGDRMSFLSRTPYGTGPVLVRGSEGTELDSGGFTRAAPRAEPYDQPHWWQTDLLPEPLRHNSGHEGSHCFITHEFVDAVLTQRRPAVDVYEAVAFTAPGIVAHQSALRDGERLTVPGFGRASET